VLASGEQVGLYVFLGNRARNETIRILGARSSPGREAGRAAG